MKEERKIVFEIDFGMGALGKIVELENNNYQCYETPLYGGEWIEYGGVFDNLNKAKDFLVNLT